MKIRCKFKDPDTMQDAVDSALARVQRPDGIDADEWLILRVRRAAVCKESIADRWMDDGEYLDVEFDTDAKTATILPRGSIR